MEANINNIISFIVKFGAALHQYGASAHRLEGAMTCIANNLGLRAHFFYTPTSIMASFETTDGHKPAIIRVEPGGMELEKLLLLNKLADQVALNEISISEASEKLEEIINMPDRYKALLTIFSFSVVSAAASTFFGASINGFLVSGFLGLLVGLTEVLMSKNQSIFRVYEFAAAFLVTVISSLLYTVFPNFSTKITILASLIILIPGLTLTIAMSELATKNLVSGTARVMSAFIVFFKIAFGVALGTKVISLIFPDFSGVVSATALPIWLKYLAIVSAPLAFTVLFKARPKDALWILIAALFGLYSTKFGSYILGPDLGAFLGALAVGVFSNLYSRIKKNPSAIPMVPGILLLVPGSIGYKGLSLIFEQKDTLTGLDAMGEMMIVAVSLVAGLLFANIIISPRRDL